MTLGVERAVTEDEFHQMVPYKETEDRYYLVVSASREFLDNERVGIIHNTPLDRFIRATTTSLEMTTDGGAHLRVDFIIKGSKLCGLTYRRKRPAVAIIDTDTVNPHTDEWAIRTLYPRLMPGYICILLSSSEVT